MMGVEHTEFTSNKRKLTATIAYPEDSAPVAGLIRIGGGANLPHWPNNWQKQLASKNIASMGFDFVGVGNSEGELEETNLSTRLEDSRQAYMLFCETTGLQSGAIYVMGGSMGAPIAIQLAVEHQCTGLILASPAAYSKEAWGKNFGEAFSSVIRTEGNWKNSIEFETLRNYSGNILLAYGSKDEVIPAPIIETYSEVVENKHETKQVLDATHTFLREESDEVEAKKKFWDSVYELIHSD